MATKPQAKSAIDAVVVTVKADIDNTLPSGVNIVDGAINFAPTRWHLTLAVEDIVAAETMVTQLQSTLSNASRPSTIIRQRRIDDGNRHISVVTTLATYKITF
jgi:hypothetical protein